MALIPIGSNQDAPVRQGPIIDIPVEVTPPTSIVVLGSTRLIETSPIGSDTADTHWTRTSGRLFPTTVSDAVAIGASTLIGAEILRVNGLINANSLALINPSVGLSTVNGNLILSDTIVGDVSLSDLVATGTVEAVNVSISDAGSIYTSINVEGALQELGDAKNLAHTHSNKALLDTYTNTNANISTAIANTHSAVTIGNPAGGLSITGQVLTLSSATNSTTGALTSTDWVIFNSKLTATTLLNAIKDLTPSDGGVVVFTGASTAKVLPIGDIGQVLTVNAVGDDLEWADATGGDTTFISKTGFTQTTATVGGIPVGTASTSLDGRSLLEIIQDMLMPTPTAPTFVLPTTALTVSGVTSTGNYVENGSTFSTSISRTYNANSSPAHSVETATRYLLNAATFTSPTAVTFASTQVFSTESDYSANMSYVYQQPNGTTLTPDQFIGYPTSNRTVTSSRTYTVVDPIYYGCITDSTAWALGTVSSIPWTKIKATTKQVAGAPSSFSMTVASYTGAADPTKWIVIAIPAAYTLSAVNYVQFSNTNVLPTFNLLNIPDNLSESTNRYVRPNSVNASYKIYYALNSYNSSESVTYTIVF